MAENLCITILNRFMKLKVLRIFLFLFLITCQKAVSQKVAVIPYVSGLSSPIDIKNCGDNRLFIAEQGGKIRVINSDGTLRTTPFLDISSKIFLGPEDGLLGLAFSPDYKSSGKFYLD